MILLPEGLHDMVEVRPRLRHRRSPDRLPHDHESQPQGHPRGRIRLGKEMLKYRKERLKMQETFEKSAKVCDVVGTSIVQQESREGGGGGVVPRGDVEFQAVEDGKCGEKKREAPERAVLVDEEMDG